MGVQDKGAYLGYLAVRDYFHQQKLKPTAPLSPHYVEIDRSITMNLVIKIWHQRAMFGW